MNANLEIWEILTDKFLEADFGIIGKTA
jgi:hypothetical protein